MKSRDIEMDLSADYFKGSNTNKFLVIGDSQSGKTTLLDYYCTGQRRVKKVKKTVGCDIHIKEFTRFKAGISIKQFIEFWDLSGDIKFLPYINVYTQAIDNNINAFKGVIFFFDMTNIKTLMNITKYLKLILEKPVTNESEEESLTPSKSIAIPLLIIGNKFDLLDPDHHSNKISLIEKYLQELFGNDPKLKYIFTSQNLDISELKDIDKFVEDCLSGNEHNLFYYDSSRELNPYDTYKKFTKQKLMSFGEDLKIFIANWKLRLNRLFRPRRREELII